jgi:ribosomal-protein-serine acetyltransferase
MTPAAEADEGNPLAVLRSDEILTARLRLRRPRRRDVGALHAGVLETLPDLIRWLPWAHEGHDRFDTRRYLRNARIARAQRSALEFVLELRETSTLVGASSLHRIEWGRRCCGLGYWIRRSAQGKGYATEAAGALAEHAIRELGLHRVEIHVALDNPASQRVAEKLGFQREGIAREVEFVNGRWVDHVQYSLLRHEITSALGEDP